MIAEIDQIAKDYGFESKKEFIDLTASADLSTAEAIAAFKHWQYNDGTKTGLLKLIKQ